MRMQTRQIWSAWTAVILTGCGFAHPASATEDIFPPLTSKSFVGRWEGVAPSTDSYFILTRGAERSTLVLTIGTKAHAFVSSGPVAVDSTGKFTLRLSPAQPGGVFKDVEVTGEGLADGDAGGGVATVQVSFPGTNRSWANVMFKRATKAETGVDRLCDAIETARSKDEELQRQQK